MTKKRIVELANFFYSSNSSKDVPLRIAYVTGQFTGFDLDKEGFISLFTILNRSKNLKKDLTEFVDQAYGEK